MIKIWRAQKLISKKVLLGRLESSEEFKAENKIETESENYTRVEHLKINVRSMERLGISALIMEDKKGLKKKKMM